MLDLCLIDAWWMKGNYLHLSKAFSDSVRKGFVILC
jgi:hypothetical protein